VQQHTQGVRTVEVPDPVVLLDLNTASDIPAE
jgi:hypothetical protein